MAVRPSALRMHGRRASRCAAVTFDGTTPRTLMLIGRGRRRSRVQGLDRRGRNLGPDAPPAVPHDSWNLVYAGGRRRAAPHLGAVRGRCRVDGRRRRDLPRVHLPMRDGTLTVDPRRRRATSSSGTPSSSGSRTTPAHVDAAQLARQFGHLGYRGAQRAPARRCTRRRSAWRGSRTTPEPPWATRGRSARCERSATCWPRATTRASPTPPGRIRRSRRSGRRSTEARLGRASAVAVTLP